eukprot:TRINITY_DN13298_c0_g1_i1.p1 TRINITY_DN13298_c0_g1~~TRINITY_DN13298_c0_g1_i1.p1  ORF type:complete len:439 (+),score=96.24 TRINITY_DN13298_c0_g1_i1:50-1366(+)
MQGRRKFAIALDSGAVAEVEPSHANPQLSSQGPNADESTGLMGGMTGMVAQTSDGVPIDPADAVHCDCTTHLRVRLEDLDLKTQRLLGSGNGGSVYSVLHRPSNQRIAFKRIRVTERTRSEIVRELAALHHGASPWIVESFGSYVHDGVMFIFLEYMDHSLDAVLKTGPLPEAALAAFTYQALRSLHYLHAERGLLHRDVKPSNFLVRHDGVVKIADFGISRQKDAAMRASIMANTFVGTLLYFSPERIRSESYGTPSDIWALALSVYIMFTGRHPFLDMASKSQTAAAVMMQKRFTESAAFTLPPNVPASDALRDFIACGLTVDPAKRPKALALLAHPFVAGWTEERAAQTMAAFLASRGIQAPSPDAGTPANVLPDASEIEPAETARIKDDADAAFGEAFGGDIEMRSAGGGAGAPGALPTSGAMRDVVDSMLNDL